MTEISPARHDRPAGAIAPEPRLPLGIHLGRNGAASACMDLSDGLADGFHQVADASGVAAHVAIEQLPISHELRAVTNESQARDWALGAGDFAVAYKRGGRTLAVATVSRDLFSLQSELAMERAET